MKLASRSLLVFWIVLAASSYVLDHDAMCQTRSRRASRPYVAGKAEARRDLQNQKLRIKIHGLPLPYSTEYAEILKKKFGIEVLWWSGCVVSRSGRENERGYNQVMESAINRKFGQGVLTEAITQAEKEYNEYMEFLANPAKFAKPENPKPRDEES